MEQGRLGAEEILIFSCRVFTMALGLVVRLAHLSLYELVDKLGLSCHNFS
jgi:hypothetical protein